MSGFKLHAHDVLRDPTKDELYNGPKREKLPVAVQKMDVADTACTFCGVSYFVFAEVQELQDRVLKYERQCKTFTAWIQRENATNAAVRHDLITWTEGFNSSMAVATAKLAELHQRNIAQTSTIQSLQAQLRAKEAEVDGIRQTCVEESASKVRHLEAALATKQCCIEEHAQQMESALREARILHDAAEARWGRERAALASQHSVKLAAEAQERQRLETLVMKMEQDVHGSAVAAQEWEAKATQSDAQLADVMRRMQVQAASVLEAQANVQRMEAMVAQYQAEAARVAANAEVERADVGALHEAAAKYQHLVTALEKNKALLLAEREELKKAVAVGDDRVKQVKTQLDVVQRRLDEHLRQTDALEATHAAAVAKLKAEFAKEVSSLKGSNAEVLDSTAATYRAQIDQLHAELQRLKLDKVPHLEQLQAVAAKRLVDAEKALEDAKARCQSYMEELQRVKLSGHQDKAAMSALERKLHDADTAHQAFRSKVDQERVDWDHKLVGWQKKAMEADAKLAAATKELQQARANPVVVKEVVVQEVPCNNNSNDKLEAEIQRLTQAIAKKDDEIHLLQLTVHRECMERTSMLEKMRSAKILPDMVTSQVEMDSRQHRDEIDGCGDDHPNGNNNGGGGNGLASLYEKLRKKKARQKTKA
ncbi:hypothetical protein H310_03728 [Aphanomyces invadans]|uniref:Uncharacterized protein n=1 Tax=Aphanomyces invadans TaxID=157072 RepID=A0A024UKJ0_9STRA|nr:hypothetical protein H310_03728 [Aphanomyces invadans]ETW06143.1 hypothetical protein H310_03728 [Aphanomyces invadans]|eukprot:XP_008865920.1 hypothetical protein H310_03728 [Aphanomyces invadans]